MFHGQIEGTGFEVIDPRFNDCLVGHVRVERLWTGARWAEGPAWFAAGRYLVFSDIPNTAWYAMMRPMGRFQRFATRPTIPMAIRWIGRVALFLVNISRGA